MSAHPYDQQNPNSPRVQTNYFGGFDVSQAPIDPGFSASMQPTFGQSWSPSAWSSMPWANNNFDGSFQPGLLQNDGFPQNQQDSAAEYSEDDDFYNNDGNQLSDAPNLTVDSNERGKISLSSQDKAPAISELVPKNSASTTMLRSQLDRVSPATPGTINPSTPSKQITTDRAKELREKLLASKRASSGTPVPSDMNNSKSVAVVESVKEAIRPDIVVSSKTTAKNNEANFDASAIQRATAQPKDKSPLNVTNLSKSSAAHADIQGLIDEYRASEVVKDPEQPSNTTAKGDAQKPSLKPGANGIVSGPKGAEGTMPRSIITNTPSKLPSGSRGSSESGEIRSDQELATAANGHDQGKESAKRLERKPPDGHQQAAAVSVPDKPQAPKAKEDHAQASKQKTISSTPKQAAQSQAISPRSSVNSSSEFRSVPLKKRIDHSRKEANQSPTSQILSGDHPHRHPSGDRHDSRSHQEATLYSTSARPAHPQTSQEANGEATRHQQGSGQEIYKKRMAVPQQQAGKELSPLPQALSSPKENPLSDQRELRNNRPPTGLAYSTESSPEKLQAHTNHDNAHTAPGDWEVNTLSLSQQEQIQRLGIDLTPEGLRDLYDFLEYHRFFVKEYREGFLARQRRLRALEAEKLALERESLMQYELFNSMRAQSLAARDPTEPPALVGLHDSKENIETPSTKPMPPPLSLPRKSTVPGVIAIKGRASTTETMSPKYPAPRANGDITSRVVQGDSNLKRQHLDDEEDLHRSRKFTRVDSDAQYSDRSQQISPRTSRSEHQILDRKGDSKLGAVDFAYHNMSPSTRRKSLSPYRQASDHSYQSRQNSWAATYSQVRDQARPSVRESRRNSANTLCGNCDRSGHFTADCPDIRRVSGNYDAKGQRREDGDYHNNRPAYTSRGNRSSSASFRGGSRGGRASYQSYKPSRGSTPYESGPAHHGAGIPNKSESLNLKAGGQSRSSSISADLP
ncbi:MAG: hypothetical protein Q9225_005806 [Loekoesia sp. 1 TL-2023]